MSRLTGMRGLAAERASQLAVDRAKRPGDDWASLTARIAAGLATIGEDLREGMAWARAAVATVRASRDYDPAVHGGTDDEIADHMLAMIAARRAGQKRAP